MQISDSYNTFSPWGHRHDIRHPVFHNAGTKGEGNAVVAESGTDQMQRVRGKGRPHTTANLHRQRPNPDPLFSDFSSERITAVPNRLVTHLNHLGLPDRPLE